MSINVRLWFSLFLNFYLLILEYFVNPVKGDRCTGPETKAECSKAAEQLGNIFGGQIDVLLNQFPKGCYIREPKIYWNPGPGGENFNYAASSICKIGE